MFILAHSDGYARMVPVLQLTIDSMAHGGEGVARHEGKVYFIADSIPGETVIADITAEKKSFGRGTVLEVLEPSPYRQEHVWDLASIERSPNDRIGGADYGHIEYRHQLELKGQVVRDALRRFANTDLEVFVQPVDPQLSYRTRVSLHVDNGGRLGQRASRSHKLIAVNDHPLAVKELRDLAPWRSTYPGAERVDLIASSGGECRVVVREPSQRNERATRHVTEVVNRREFKVAESGFWQVHRAAPETLTNAVRKAIDPELLDTNVEHADLYGGVGLLAVPLLEALSDSRVKLVTVESDESATDFAAENLADWVGTRAVTARVESFVRNGGIAKGSTVVLDPTRQGAGRQTMVAILASQPAQVVYVACDPVAFARDLGIAKTLDWELTHLEAFDMFPQTHHVELVARLMPARRY